MNTRQGNPQRLQLSFDLTLEIILIPEDKLDQRVLKMRMWPDHKLVEMQIFSPSRDGIGHQSWTPIISKPDLFNFLAGVGKLVSEQRHITLALEVENQLHKWKFEYYRQPASNSPPLRAVS